MNSMQLNIPGEKASYLPGDAVRVEAAWNLDAEPRAVNLRLFWYTQGKGTTDSVIVAEEAYVGPLASGKWNTSLAIPPDAISSYTGRLLSVIWAVEIVAEKKLGFARREIVVSTTGAAIQPPLG